jgi:hypothetical protein
VGRSGMTVVSGFPPSRTATADRQPDLWAQAHVSLMPGRAVAVIRK